jgi:DNA-binding transcriptional regulator YhcF (GntR family)
MAATPWSKRLATGRNDEPGCDRGRGRAGTRLLEAAGVVVSRTGRGTAIATTAPRLTERQRSARLVTAARDYVAAIQRLGIAEDQALAAVRDLL